MPVEPCCSVHVFQCMKTSNHEFLWRGLIQKHLDPWLMKHKDDPVLSHVWNLPTAVCRARHKPWSSLFRQQASHGSPQNHMKSLCYRHIQLLHILGWNSRHNMQMIKNPNEKSVRSRRFGLTGMRITFITPENNQSLFAAVVSLCSPPT